MKTLRIILLALIVVGLAAIATQKIWIPKVVSRILLSELGPVTPIAPSIETIPDGRYCYSYSHDATKAEPYATTEFIDMKIQGSSVSGTKRGTQNGPDMSNGYEGMLTGTIQSRSIASIFSYVIEGSRNSEKELYQVRADQTGIEKLRYPLTEEKGLLVPDLTKPFTTIAYSRVGCVASK